MKQHALLVGVLFIVSLAAFSQDNPSSPTPNDSIYMSLQRIKAILDEKNYTRIPNEDFDKALELKLSEKVNSQVVGRIDAIRNLVLVILAIIGGALLLGLKSLVNNTVSDQLKEKLKETDEDLKEKIKLYYLENVKEGMNKDLTAFKNEIGKELNAFKEELTNQLNVLKEKSDQMHLDLALNKKLTLEQNINKIKLDKSRKDHDANFNQLKEYLKEAEQLKDKDLISAALTELSAAAYLSKKDTEMENIVNHLMNQHIEIKENVFVNLAAAFFYEYSATRLPEIRDKSMIYLNQSLLKIHDYGEALGLKLEVLMVDYEESVDESRKQEIRKKAENVINQILASKYAGQETLNRFNRVKVNSVEKHFIDLLYEVLPEKMAELEAQAGGTVTTPVATATEMQVVQ